MTKQSSKTNKSNKTKKNKREKSKTKQSTNTIMHSHGQHMQNPKSGHNELGKWQQNPLPTTLKWCRSSSNRLLKNPLDRSLLIGPYSTLNSWLHVKLKIERGRVQTLWSVIIFYWFLTRSCSRCSYIRITCEFGFKIFVDTRFYILFLCYEFSC